MAQDRITQNLAVLIDADNASAKIAGALFEEIAKIGDASIRRVYGDFSQQRLKPWTDLLAEHAIVPRQQFAYTTGKNASDITLVIEAMDILHERRVDGFCLVSSDSDFTRLASRIREEGLKVYGFGEHKTPTSLRQACHQFFYVENLLQPTAKTEPDHAGTKPLLPLSEIIPTIRKAFEQVEGEDGLAHLGAIGNQIVKLDTSFDVRSYGFTKLIDLVRKTGAFDVDHKPGTAPRIRLSHPQKKSQHKKPAN